MQNTLYLFDGVPKYWKNFIDYFYQEEAALFQELSLSVYILINKYLKIYNADYDWKFTNCVTFDTEEDMVVFILRWS